MSYLEDKAVLVTGGAGSLGRSLVKQLLSTHAKAIRVFDNDEYGLFLLTKEFEDPRLRFLLGDIRDRERMQLALRGIDHVIHTAAAKNIEVTEYNMPEAVRVNITGTINLIETAIVSDVEKFLFVSSDKAVHFSTLYGATKFIGERLILWAGHISGKTFSNIRMGNFLESRGNVFETWERETMEKKELTLTSSEMKRYFIPTEQAAKMALRVLELMKGRETFIPKMEIYSMHQLMKQLYPNAQWVERGVRKGEKLVEELLTPEESEKAVFDEVENFWVIREG